MCRQPCSKAQGLRIRVALHLCFAQPDVRVDRLAVKKRLGPPAVSLSGEVGRVAF